MHSAATSHAHRCGGRLGFLALLSKRPLTKLQVVSYGRGALSDPQMLAELPALAETLARGAFQTQIRTLPLSEVTRGRQAPVDGVRLVFTPWQM